MATWRLAGNSAVPGAAYVVHTDDFSCHWAAYDRDGRRLAASRDHNAPTAAELAEWDAQAVEIAARAAAWPYGSTPVYIRWLDLPPKGRSRNHATGQLEAGVSVYAARFNPATGLVEYADGGLPWAALSYLVTGKPAYLVTGTPAGAGSDGEPVLRQVRILARLRPVRDGFEVSWRSSSG